MSRLDEILELLQSRESHFSRPFMESMIGWMGELPDAQVVELLRCAATELAWRATGGHAGESSVYPSNEVFYEATEGIAKAFYDQVKERNIDRGD